MNNTFDMRRFGLLLRKDFRALWPRNGVGMIILASVPLVIWLFMLLIGQWVNEGLDTLTTHPGIRQAFILSCALLAACIAPFRLYGECNTRRGIHFAMLPASKLEKFLSMLFYSFLVVPLLVVCGGVVVDSLLTLMPFGSFRESLFAIPGMIDAHELLADTMPYEGLRVMLFVTNPLLWIVLYLNTVVCFLFTNTIFKRNKFILTILAQWALSLVMELVLTPLFLFLGFSDWMDGAVRYLDAWDIDQFFSVLGTIVYGSSLLWIVVLGWWSWRRLKKMHY